MKKTISRITILLFILILVTLSKVQGIECDPGISTSGRSQEELNELINKCASKKDELSQKRNTLSSEIQYMDTQIYLTALRIQETEQKIILTGKEIDLLGNRIEGLDQSLDYISKLLLDKIVQSYKQREVSLFGLLFDSQSAEDLMSKIKYVKTARDNNQKLLVQVQEAKSNFEEQKKLREEKKTELDQLNETLNQQKISLDSQKSQKQKLLADTQNDEATYQRIISQARAQLAAFKSFVQSSGVSSPIGANAFGNGKDGNYYSQRDSRWAYQAIGNSSENILNVGCLLTSVAMSLKKKGVNTDPSAIAATSEYFYLNTAQMNYRWNLSFPNGLRGYQLSTSQVDDELNNGNYVIAGINHGGSCGSYSDHFVVLTGKEGNEYKMHDPLYGPDINFSSYYSQICWAEVIK